MTIASRPPVRRLAVAFLLAPLVPSFVSALLASFDDSPAWATQVLMATLTHAWLAAWPLTLLFGVPAHVLLRRRARMTAAGCSLVGMAMAGLSFLLFAVAFAEPWACSAQARHVATCAALGAMGGPAFWALAVRPLALGPA